MNDEPPNKLKLLAFGVQPRGIIAIGVLAQGVVAIGVNAVGVVAIGVNAMGTAAAVGLNAVGFVALSAANSIGLIALSTVNSIGGFGAAYLNTWLHPAVGMLLVGVLGAVRLKLRGTWHAPATTPPLVPLAQLQRGRVTAGWTEVLLLDVQDTDILVGNRDSQQALVAPSAVLAQADELRRELHRRVLIRIEVDYRMDSGPRAAYRAQALRTAVMRATEIRPVPRRPPWPERLDELSWVISRSAMLFALIGLALLVVGTALGWR